jgi:hypothetical protein
VDIVPIRSPGWPQTCDSPASAPQVLWLQVGTTIPSFHCQCFILRS